MTVVDRKCILIAKIYSLNFVPDVNHVTSVKIIPSNANEHIGRVLWDVPANSMSFRFELHYFGMES